SLINNLVRKGKLLKKQQAAIPKEIRRLVELFEVYCCWLCDDRLGAVPDRSRMIADRLACPDDRSAVIPDRSAWPDDRTGTYVDRSHDEPDQSDTISLLYLT